MPERDIIVIGASAGGVEALTELMRGLPRDFAASIFIVLHTSPQHRSRLPEVLGKVSPLPVAHAEDGQRIERGRVYIAPPDRHLLIRGDHLELSRGPRENRTRPAADPLFRTAARSYGPRVIGVVLSGTFGDGSMGLMAIKARGGIAVVQDPGELVHGEMPRRAMEYADVDHVASIREMPQLLERLTHEPITGGADAMTTTEERVDPEIERDITAQVDGERAGSTSVYSCPECGGVLWQRDEGRLVQFKCHVGHTYSSELLLVDKSESLESALWACVRMLVEKATLTRQVAARLRAAGDEARAERVSEQAELDEQHMRAIREMLQAWPNPTAQALDVSGSLLTLEEPPRKRG